MFLSHYSDVYLLSILLMYLFPLVTIHNSVYLYWRFSSASRASSVPENEADNGEDNPEIRRKCVHSTCTGRPT